MIGELYLLKIINVMMRLYKLIRILISSLKDNKVLRFGNYMIIIAIYYLLRKKKDRLKKMKRVFFFDRYTLDRNIKITDKDNDEEIDDVLINFINKNNRVRQKYGLNKENIDHSFYKIMKAYLQNCNIK
jgi:hypothetical protein